MEVEFVRGVKMGVDTAKDVYTESKSLGIELSVHSPYYVNLNSPDDDKRMASVKRIKDSARIGSICGAKSIVIHPGFYMKNPKKSVYGRIKNTLRDIHDGLIEEGVEVTLRPETTGRRTQFGTLEELINLSAELEGVEPCIDFSHIHARTGRFNSEKEYGEVLEKIEEKLGKESLENMHIHVSGIEYSLKGEKEHLNLLDSDLRFEELLKTWRDFNIRGLVICESPNLEVDALLLQKSYRKVIEVDN